MGIIDNWANSTQPPEFMDGDRRGKVVRMARSSDGQIVVFIEWDGLDATAHLAQEIEKFGVVVRPILGADGEIMSMDDWVTLNGPR